MKTSNVYVKSICCGLLVKATLIPTLLTHLREGGKVETLTSTKPTTVIVASEKK